MTLTIQLLGETNQFDRIVPFCIKWYGETGLVPAYVLSIVCVTLVAGNRIGVAEDILEQWYTAVSQNWTIFEDVDVNLLATTAVCEVFCPQRKFSTAEEFINKISIVLSSSTITDLRDHVRCLTVSPPSPGTPATPINGDSPRSSVSSSKPSGDTTAYIAVLRKILDFLYSLFRRSEVVAAVVFLVLRRAFPLRRRRTHLLLSLLFYIVLRAARLRPSSFLQ